MDFFQNIFLFLGTVSYLQMVFSSQKNKSFIQQFFFFMFLHLFRSVLVGNLAIWLELFNHLVEFTHTKTARLLRCCLKMRLRF